MKSFHGRTELKPYTLLISADPVQIQRPGHHLVISLLRVWPSMNHARKNFYVNFVGGYCPTELKCKCYAASDI